MSEGKTNRIGLIVAGIVVVLIAVVIAATRHQNSEPAVSQTASTEAPSSDTAAAMSATGTESAQADSVVNPNGVQPTAPVEMVADKSDVSSSQEKANAAKSATQAKERMDVDKGMGAESNNSGDQNFDPKHPYTVYKNGDVTKFTYKGFMRYGMFCFHCHGPDGLGSSYAPNLTQSLKRMSYEDFVQTVMNGRNAISNSTFNVMPSFGTDPNVADYIDNLYSYLKGRSDGAIGRGRPHYKGQKILK